MKKKKITLKSIADTTGFSISTISRALRGEGRISEDNRNEILATAHKLGYELPTGKKMVPQNLPPYIAVITQLTTGEFYTSFFHGFHDAAVKRGVQVSLFSVSHDYTRVDKLIINLRSLGYQAAVIFVPELKEHHYELILHAIPKDFPVLSCSNINNPVLDTVTFDAYRGASLVANHFLDQGYRRLGLIEGPQEKPEARFRTNGFIDFAKHNPDIEICWTYTGDYTPEAGTLAYDDFKKLKNKPRAVFAANDAMALNFMEAARADGWSFPDQIALAGYDNLLMCKNHYPQVTSVNTNYSKLAGNTLDSLLARLKKPVPHQGIVSLVPVSLKIRQSSLNSSKSNPSVGKEHQSAETG